MPNPGEKLNSNTEIVGLAGRLKQTFGRLALSTSLIFGGGAIAGIGLVSLEPEPADAAEDYPHADAPCYPPSIINNPDGSYNRCDDYDWRIPTKDADGKIIAWPEWTSRGYGARNCTDYAAYRIGQITGVVPSYYGNANNWDNKGAALGLTVDMTPEVGDAAVWEGTDGYGHVAVVESVNADGTVNVSEYNKKGDGTFGTRQSITAEKYVDFNGTSTAVSSANPAPAAPTTYSRSEARRAADFNGDGYDDIYASGQRGDPAQNEIVYRGGNWLGPGGLWGTPPASSIKFNDVFNLTADINGDGKDDLITIKNKDGEGNPIILWQKSTGSSFASPLEVGIPSLISKNTRWAAGDVTGDGKDDLLAFSKRGDSGVNIFVFRSLTSWLGAMEFWGNTNEQIQFESTRMLPGDFNGDGKEDLYAISKGNGGTQPHLFRLKSNGQNFEPGVLTRIINDAYENINFTAVDLDADGKTDLLASSKRSDVHPNLVAHLSDGANGYKPNGGLWSAPSELIWKGLQFIPADLDKDGDKDLIAIQSSNSTNPSQGNPQLWWVKNNRTHFARPVLVGQPNIQWGTYHYGY